MNSFFFIYHRMYYSDRMYGFMLEAYPGLVYKINIKYRKPEYVRYQHIAKRVIQLI